MVIVQVYRRKPTPVSNITMSHLKNEKPNTQQPYITAYFKAEARNRLKFVIGTGGEYTYQNKKYVNQPLRPNTNYIVFLRFLENEVI